MNIKKKDRSVFSAYLKPLRQLERAFQSAGIPVVFEGRDWPVHGRTVYVTLYPRHKAICIEGISVCQAVRDVAVLVFDLMSWGLIKDD